MSHKNLISTTALSLFIFTIAVLLSVKVSFAKVEEKVQICQNGHTIEVSENAVKGLLNSGATEGPCVSPSVPEFGMITGALALAGSAGSYFLLKRRAIRS